MRKAAVLAFAAWLLAACAPPAVVFVAPNYQPGQVRRVALVSMTDFPGTPGSGAIVSGTFEKYLLWAGYDLVERRQVRDVLKEQSLTLSRSVDPNAIRKLGSLLGVDAVVIGDVTDFTNVRQETVMVDIPQEHTEPIYGEVVTVQRQGDTTVKTVQSVVTGYNVTHTTRVVPETQTFPAHVGLSVRLVDVRGGQVLWSSSGSADGVDLGAAAEQASSKIMQAVVKQLQKAGQ